MFRPFERGTSAVDWCEGNYVMSATVAEFANTLTCFYYIFFPPILMYLFQPYARHVTPGIHIVWILLIIVGVTSAYFHATLSMVGQILDELSILWVMLAGTYLWAPPKVLPNVFKQNRKIFIQSIVMFGIIGTGLAFIQPAFNAFALMTFGIPAAVLLLVEVRRSNDSRAVRLGLRCAGFWVFGVICWINDRMFCEMWSSAFNFQYFHAIWHILIFNAAYPACVLYAYFHVRYTLPHKKPTLNYWPCDSFEYGVPYVQFYGETPAHKNSKKV
ncbi:hypothetical protein CHUAL_013802 [Chamberlinius hualienensis]